jgi:hypothetical protein
MTPLLLELFCGTKSVGRQFEAEGWEVFSFDLAQRHVDRRRAGI